MAKRTYLVEGLSGAGKSSVYEELIRRGYKAVGADRAWAYHADPDTGLPGGPIRHDTFMWDQHKAVRKLPGSIDVDATQPLHQVVDELLRLAS
jgi:hypothetical protein